MQISRDVRIADLPSTLTLYVHNSSVGEGDGTPLQYSCLKIPWTEEPGGLQSMGSLRVGHDLATSLSLFTFTHWRRKWQPLQCSCLENPRDGGAWWAPVYGVTQSRTRLKRLSSSSSSSSTKFYSGVQIVIFIHCCREWSSMPIDFSIFTKV